MKMYVGNLSYSTTEQDLKEIFGEHGEVTDVHVAMDRETGQPRGFAFVTMDTKAAMVNAIKALDGFEVDGRSLRVNEARPREEGGGGGGRSGGSNFRSGGNNSYRGDRNDRGGRR